MENKKIGISGLPNLYHQMFTEKGLSLNIMVAGSHGLGKTTFINQLLQQSVLPVNPHSKSVYDLVHYPCDIQTSNLVLHENGFGLKLNIVEVDRIGDHSQYEGIAEAISKIFIDRFILYENAFKNDVRANISDPRIHLCLYFLEPIDYIKQSDVYAMKTISEHCNLIPIIGKADILNLSEREILKDYFSNILESAGINFYETLDVEFPFFISSGEMSSYEKISDCRTYPWGVLLLSNEINEFIKLRQFILEKSILSLFEETEYFYDKFRIYRFAKSYAKKNPKSINRNIYQLIENNQKELDALNNDIVNKKRALAKFK